MSEVKYLVPLIQKWEGKFSNDPLDSGGATMMGITLHTYKAYCRLRGRPAPSVNDLKNISDEDWMDVLRVMFWDHWKADQIQNQSIANICVDWLWNSGVWGIKIPQRILGLKEDGIVGAITLNALNSTNQLEFFRAVKLAREKFYWDIVRGDKKNTRFIKGWLARIADFKFTL